MRFWISGLGMLAWAVVGVTIRWSSFDTFVMSRLRRLGSLSGEAWAQMVMASSVPFCGLLIGSAAVWLLRRTQVAAPDEDPRLPMWARIGTTVLLLPFALAYVHNTFAEVFGITDRGVQMLTMLGIAVGFTTLWIALLFWRWRAPRLA